jgi:hypothetical protein
MSEEHIIPFKPMKPNYKPTRYVCFDIETKRRPDTHEISTDFLMVGITEDGEKVDIYTDLNSFVRKHFTRRNDGAIFYAFNGGRFDNQFLIAPLIRNGYSVSILPGGGKMVIMTAIKGKHKWRIWDVNQILSGTLDANCKSFETRRQKTPEDIDVANMRDTPETRAYLTNDCLALHDLVGALYSMPQLRGVKHAPTASSLALRVFATHFLKKPIPGLTTEKEVFVRGGLYGGRTEVFRYEGSDVTEQDVHAMYVWGMTNSLPFGKGTWVHEWRDDMVGFYEADVVTPNNLRIPVLPVRRDKLRFELGTFRGIWYSEELKLAARMGYQINIIRGLVFHPVPFLKEYAEWCFALRGEGGVIKALAKILGNGLYGKFTQEREKREVRTATPEEVSENGYELAYAPLNLFFIPTISHSPHILPHIGAAITSLARIKLYSALEAAGEHACYSDTDSVFTCCGTLLPEALRGDGLGQFGVEGHYERIRANLPKLYALENTDAEGNKHYKVRAKGFPTMLIDPKRAEKKVAEAKSETARHFAMKRLREAEENVQRILRGESIEAEWWDVGTLLNLMRHPDANTRTGEGLTGEVRKKRRIVSRDDKRVWIENGETLPYGHLALRTASEREGDSLPPAIPGESA